MSSDENDDIYKSFPKRLTRRANAERVCTELRNHSDIDGLVKNIPEVSRFWNQFKAADKIYTCLSNEGEDFG